MKKSVILMASILAVALAGSAQAATMFAVQDATGTIDKASISDAGDIAIAGTFFGGSTNVPKGPLGETMTAPAGVFHVASESNIGPNAAFLAQHTAVPTTVGGSTFGAVIAPNFSFYRINRYDASHPTTPNAYVLPIAGNMLGFFQFGTLNTALDPNLGSSRKNSAGFYVRAESTWTSVTDTPTYFSWNSSPIGGALTERMRLSSAGNLGINTIDPKSKLHVVGLPVFADNAAAIAGGLTAGAIYTNGAGGLFITF